MKAIDWREIYAHKLVSADEAVSHIRSGDQIGFGCYLAEAPALVAALVRRAPLLKDVEIRHPMSPGPGGYVQPGMESHFHHTTFYIGNEPYRRRRDGHPIDFMSSFFHEWPRSIKSGKFGTYDAAMVCLSEPDENGYCSYGLDCSYNPALLRHSRMVMVQINKNLPRTGGYKFHLGEADFIVEEDAPLYPVSIPPASEEETKIGNFVASLIPDGATIQCGIGGIPNSALEALKVKNDLGIHSEMMTEKMMELTDLGVITGKNKSMHVGKLVLTNVCPGSQAYFEWMDQNPKMELYPVNYVNDPVIIGRQRLMCSVNSAVEADLLGQLNSEMVRGEQFSGIGGQLDFFRGVRRSEGGISILAMPATRGNGKFSSIVAGLMPGTCVTTSRHDVDYIVTEYGIAHMYMESAQERAEQLISIAHPAFRDELTQAMKAMRL